MELFFDRFPPHFGRSASTPMISVFFVSAFTTLAIGFRDRPLISQIWFGYRADHSAWRNGLFPECRGPSDRSWRLCSAWANSGGGSSDPGQHRLGGRSNHLVLRASHPPDNERALLEVQHVAVAKVGYEKKNPADLHRRGLVTVRWAGPTGFRRRPRPVRYPLASARPRCRRAAHKRHCRRWPIWPWAVV